MLSKLETEETSVIVHDNSYAASKTNKPDEEKDDGWRYLLGGLSTNDVTAAAWDYESSSEESTEEKKVEHPSLQTNKPSCKSPRTYLMTNNEEPSVSSSSWFSNNRAFSYAYQSCHNGLCVRVKGGAQITRPPVRIVDLSAVGLGNALLATETIEKGQIIFTERAAVASQIPSFGTKVHPCEKSSFSIRACQQCFRSMEPIASCYSPHETRSASVVLPSPHLWPVPDFEFDFAGTHGVLRRDKFGRIQCLSCRSWFCSESCRSDFQQQFGSCCCLVQVMEELPKLMTPQKHTDVLDDGDVTDDDGVWDVEEAIVLAVRMFVMSLHFFRTDPDSWKQHGTLLDDLCGDASDLQALQLGVPFRNTNDGNIVYNLSRLHQFITTTYSLSGGTNGCEQEIYSLDFLHRLAAVAARNGFDIMPQSPFQTYYAALLRSIGGRGSTKHAAVQEQVARAVFDTQRLERDMDRRIGERVVPSVVALFPLTSRINHACGEAANAQVRAQEYVDCRIDVVATRSIQVGEEITISYLGKGPGSGTGRLDRAKRQRELQAKYLFLCSCDQCTEDR